MKKLLLAALIIACPSMRAFCATPLLDTVIATSVTLAVQGAATLLSEAGAAGAYVGSAIGGSIGSASGVIFGSEIGAEAGRRIVEISGQQVQHLPQSERLQVAAGFLAAGYVVARYGTRIVLRLPI